MIDWDGLRKRLSNRARVLLGTVKTGSSPFYYEFNFPLNVFMYVLTKEEGKVSYLHYGLFEKPCEGLATAQERATRILLERVMPPPLRLLEVGAGLGTLLARLDREGYDAEGITPDEEQVRAIRINHGAKLRVFSTTFEEFSTHAGYDLLLFHESSQYIDPTTLFAKASRLAPRVLVLDEFAAEPLSFPGALTPLDKFIKAATLHGYELTEELDVSIKAAPTVDYFMRRLMSYREELISELRLTPEKIDGLISSGFRYKELYSSGLYVYRLFNFER